MGASNNIFYPCLKIVDGVQNVITDFNKGENLDGENYDIWHRKVQYLFVEQEILKTLTQSMEAPPVEGSGPQHRCDAEAYAK